MNAVFCKFYYGLSHVLISSYRSFVYSLPFIVAYSIFFSPFCISINFFFSYRKVFCAPCTFRRLYPTHREKKSLIKLRLLLNRSALTFHISQIEKVIKTLNLKTQQPPRKINFVFVFMWLLTWAIASS